jgi:hypothetical protein
VSEAPGGDGRRRLVALLVVSLVLVPLVVVALVTGGEGSPSTGLRIERSTAPGTAATPQIVVYFEDQSANVPQAAGGRSTVELECLDRDGRTVLRGDYAWPFTDTDQGILDPHIHQNVTAQESERIVRCRLNGTEGPLQGRPSAAGLN